MPRSLSVTDRHATAATERLTTGRRIVRASDDAAGLTVAERVLAQHSGLAVAERAARDGISLIATADGALAELHAGLQRVRELAVQWSSATLGERDRAAIQAEATALGDEAARLYETTSFNGLALLQGGTLALHVGAYDGDTIASALPDVSALLEEDPFTFGTTAQSVAGGSTGTSTQPSTPGGKATGYWKKQTPPAAPAAPAAPATPPVTASMGTLARIDWAIDLVTEHRAAIGAVHSRLEHRLSALGVERAQLVGAESRIRDADMAYEVTALTRARILREAQAALVAQAQRADRGRALALLS